MIREYDKLYNGFIESMVELEKKSKATLSTVNEVELLERISRLEVERDRNMRKIEHFSSKNIRLESMIQNMDKVQKEFETANEKIQFEETQNLEELKYDFERATNDLKETQNENKRLSKANEQLVEILGKMELEKEEQMQKMKNKMEELEAKAKQKEQLEKDYEMKVNQLKADLKQKKTSFDQLNEKRIEYQKKYNVVQQLNKTLESSINSLRKELEETNSELENERAQARRTKDAVEEVVRRWKGRPEVQELVELFGDVVSLHENLDDDLGSMCESRIELNQDLKQLDEECQGMSLNVSQLSSVNVKNVSKFEMMFMRNVSEMQSHGATPKQFDKRMSFVKHKKDPSVDFENFEDKIYLNEDFGKRKGRQKEENKKKREQKFQTDLQQEIDHKINSRYKSNFVASKKDILENAEDASKKRNEARFEEFKRGLQASVFEEFEGFSKSALNELEREHLKAKWLRKETVQEGVAEVVGFLREKILELHSKNKALNSEKSKR